MGQRSQGWAPACCNWLTCSCAGDVSAEGSLCSLTAVGGVAQNLSRAEESCISGCAARQPGVLAVKLEPLIMLSDRAMRAEGPR